MKKFTYTEYLVTGLNLDRLLNLLAKRDIILYNVRKKDKKSMLISIKTEETQKFFVFLNKLCYNVKKVREYGVFKPIEFLKRNLGVTFGILIFVVSTFLFNNLLLGIEFNGSGAYLKNYANAVLEENGIKKYAFTNKDVTYLSEKILSSTDKFNFVSVKKDGLWLKVTLIESQKENNLVDKTLKNLSSTVDGEIESIKVYRGTAVKNVGDKVSKGDIIVDGYTISKEEVIPTYVLARVSIIATKRFEYFSSKEIDENHLMLLFSQEIENPITESTVIKKESQDGYLYELTFKYRVQIQ